MILGAFLYKNFVYCVINPTNMKLDFWWAIVIFIILFVLLKQCESKSPEQVIDKETIIEWKTDTVTKTVIDTLVKTVYVDKLKTVKGKDSIIYTETTIEANQYTTQLTSNQATADLKITTTGELIDVQGFIKYPEKETITTITNNIDNSGKFIFLKTDVVNPLQSLELGVFAHANNKLGVIGSIGYDTRLNNPSVNLGIAIKF